MPDHTEDPGSAGPSGACAFLIALLGITSTEINLIAHFAFKPMHTITLYAFRLKHERTGKWYTARHKMTLEEAAQRHGEGNYELIENSEVVHQVDPDRASAAHLQSTPGMRAPARSAVGPEIKNPAEAGFA